MHFWFWKAKNIQFYSNFNAGNIGKQRELSVAERAKTVTLNEKGNSGRQASKFCEFLGLAQVWKSQGYLPNESSPE